MTDELASQPGTLATRPDDEQEAAPSVEAAVAPLDFRLNLKARLAEPVEALTTREHPLIRKLKWEHVVADLPEEPSAIGATRVPLPPPPPAPVPPPPVAVAFQPPISAPVAATPVDPTPPSPPPEPVAKDPAPVVPAAPSVEAPAVVADAVEQHHPIVTDDAPTEGQAEEEVAADDVSGADMLVDDVVDEEEERVEPVAVAPVAVVAEVNRLASVPDLIVDDSPIEIPPITPSGGPIAAQPPAAAVFAPVLPDSMFVAAARPITSNVAALIAESAPSASHSRRKPKRHPFRKLFSFLVLLGLLGGGAYVARKYLLDKQARPTWSAELDPLATDVATTRGLEFKSSVDVQAITPDAYAARLAASVLPDQPGRAEAWRALGLVNGDLDVASIGRQAMNDMPAFYDPTTKTIYVSDDLKAYEHLYRFAIHRALTAALLDQRFDWSSRVVTASPAAALGLRATIDGDALTVANTLALRDTPDQLAPEMFTFVQSHGGAPSPSQYASAIVGRAGVAMRPTITAMSAGGLDALSVLEQATPGSDAGLDAGRPAATTVAAGDSQGMMFWYYVLAGRLDDTQAWSAISHWSADSLSQLVSDTAQCVDAKVTAGDTDGATLLLNTFQAWAALAPPESATIVTPLGANQVGIHACDPGAAVAAAQAPKVPVTFGGAGAERALVQAAISAAAQIKVDANCVIAAARLRGTLLTMPADDPPVIAVDWQPAYVAANLDVAAGCVATTG